MPRPSDLPAAVLSQVRSLTPSRDGDASYFPCRVRLRDGTEHARVILVDADAFARHWGVVPQRTLLNACDLVRVDATPLRLPARFADRLYKAGESGMGYCAFVLQFRDGSQHPYVTGNAVDFLEYPAGQGAADVIGVEPHAGRESPSPLRSLEFEWCPVAGLDALPGLARSPWWKFWRRAPAV